LFFIIELGANFKHYESSEPPRIILDRLNKLNFSLVGMTGCGQSVLWTLFRDK